MDLDVNGRESLGGGELVNFEKGGELNARAGGFNPRTLQYIPARANGSIELDSKPNCCGTQLSSDIKYRVHALCARIGRGGYSKVHQIIYVRFLKLHYYNDPVYIHCVQCTFP